jgi:hypothetical protein
MHAYIYIHIKPHMHAYIYIHIKTHTRLLEKGIKNKKNKNKNKDKNHTRLLEKGGSADRPEQAPPRCHIIIHIVTSSYIVSHHHT